MTDQVKQKGIEKLKKRWDLKNDIEFFFVCILFLLSYVGGIFLSEKILNRYGIDENSSLLLFWGLRIAISFVACYLLHLILTRNKALKTKWELNSNIQLLIIYTLFSITGSASIRIARPILEFIGVTDATPPYFYWPLRVLVVFPTYQTLFMIFGTMLGQWKFAWKFEKKMLRGLGRLVGIKSTKEQHQTL